jgi:hypothetical protein
MIARNWTQWTLVTIAGLLGVVSAASGTARAAERQVTAEGAVSPAAREYAAELAKSPAGDGEALPPTRWPGAESPGVELQYEIVSPPPSVDGSGEGATRTDRSNIYPPPIYSYWYDIFYGELCQYPWQDCAYVGPDCGDGLWTPQVYFPGQCGEYGGCDCWSTFATWYYQNNLMCWGISGPVEAAPLTFDSYAAAIDPLAPPAPTYYAHFEPIEGFDCLKNIPLECTNSIRPVAAAARYTITVGGSTSSPSDYAGALFFITAVYDDTIFDVKVAGEVLTHPGAYYESV